jgi:hypothetical protein
MRKLSIAFIIMLVAFSAFAEKPVYLGEKLELTKQTKISELIKYRDKYNGKTVQVEGIIIDVCSARGCWMALASDQPFQHLTVSVNDGVIVFPMHSKGRVGVAEGVFEYYEMDMEETIDHLKHKAEESGRKFDPKSVKKPITLYEIFATGAMIK